jgi:hypothetical protein
MDEMKAQSLEDASGGSVEITPEAAKIARDGRQMPPEISSDAASEAIEETPLPRRSTSSKQSQPDTNQSWPFLASGLNFLVGVLGNLVAAWIQQDLLSNVFTPPRIAIVLFLTGVVLITGVWIQHRSSLHSKQGMVIIAVLIALTAVVAIIFPVFLPRPGSFDYTVQVQAQDTGEDISNAEVRIEVGEGKAPLSGITDANGLARISVDASYMEKPAILIVEAFGYKKRRQEIDLIKGNRAYVVQLEPAP